MRPEKVSAAFVGDATAAAASKQARTLGIGKRPVPHDESFTSRIHGFFLWLMVNEILTALSKVYRWLRIVIIA
jgi:hypothetical protein